MLRVETEARPSNSFGRALPTEPIPGKERDIATHPAGLRLRASMMLRRRQAGRKGTSGRQGGVGSCARRPPQQAGAPRTMKVEGALAWPVGDRIKLERGSVVRSAPQIDEERRRVQRRRQGGSATTPAPLPAGNAFQRTIQPPTSRRRNLNKAFRNRSTFKARRQDDPLARRCRSRAAAHRRLG